MSFLTEIVVHFPSLSSFLRDTASPDDPFRWTPPSRMLWYGFLIEDRDFSRTGSPALSSLMAETHRVTTGRSVHTRGPTLFLLPCSLCSGVERFV